MKAGVLTAELETFATRSIVWRDRIWTDAAIHYARFALPALGSTSASPPRELWQASSVRRLPASRQLREHPFPFK